jgi:hypothetical protein
MSTRCVHPSEGCSPEMLQDDTSTSVESIRGHSIRDQAGLRSSRSPTQEVSPHTPGLTSPACPPTVDICRALVWPLLAMTEAPPRKELFDEETTGQPCPRLEESGPAGAPPPLPLLSAAQLLTRAFPGILSVSRV